MSMMTSTLLCAVQKRIAQSNWNSGLFLLSMKSVFLVGDLTQLPPICKHTLKALDNLCRSCHISFAPRWSSSMQRPLLLSLLHALNPAYLQFLNIIRHQTPTESELQSPLSKKMQTHRQM